MRSSLFHCLLVVVALQAAHEYLSFGVNSHSSIFVTALSSSGSSVWGRAPVEVSRSQNNGCPYTITKQFLNRQTAFIAQSILPKAMRANMIRNPAIDDTLSHQLNGIPNGQIQTPLPKDAAFSKTVLHAQKEWRSLYENELKLKKLQSTRLFSTTLEPPVVKATGGDPNPDKPDKKKKKKKNKGGNTPLEVIVVGLSHHNAKVDVREKLAIPEDGWNAAAEELCAYPSISEACPLSTCNRFEVYIAGQNQYECMKDAMDFLEKRSGGTCLC